MVTEMKQFSSKVKGLDQADTETTSVWRRNKGGGELTVSKESSGDVNLTYYVKEEDGSRVTLQGRDEGFSALVERPGGYARFYRLEQRPEGIAIAAAEGEGEGDADLALIRSAKLMFQSALSSQHDLEGFDRVDPYEEMDGVFEDRES